MNHAGEKPLKLKEPHSICGDPLDHGQVVMQIRRTTPAIQSALSLDILPGPVPGPSRTRAGVTAQVRLLFWKSLCRLVESNLRACLEHWNPN